MCIKAEGGDFEMQDPERQGKTNSTENFQLGLGQGAKDPVAKIIVASHKTFSLTVFGITLF